MIRLKYQKLKGFIWFGTTALVALPNAVWGGPGLRAMAEAQQQTYLEVRKLGENATPTQIDQIAKTASADASRKLDADHASTYKTWRSILRKKHDEMVAEPGAKLQKQIAAGGKQTVDRTPAAESKSISAPAQSRNVKSDTGSYDGSGTATIVNFGNKK